MYIKDLTHKMTRYAQEYTYWSYWYDHHVILWVVYSNGRGFDKIWDELIYSRYYYINLQ